MNNNDFLFIYAQKFNYIFNNYWFLNYSIYIYIFIYLIICKIIQINKCKNICIYDIIPCKSWVLT